jgi:putative redox protein
MPRIEVELEERDRYRIGVGGHELWVDQPVEDGGADSAPTPTELFVAGLASCVAFYAGRFLRRHGLPEKGLRVDAGFAMATDRPARVESIELRVQVPPGIPEERRAALLAVIEHCTVHTSIVRTPEITFELLTERRAA